MSIPMKEKYAFPGLALLVYVLVCAYFSTEGFRSFEWDGLFFFALLVSNLYFFPYFAAIVSIADLLRVILQKTAHHRKLSVACAAVGTVILPLHILNGVTNSWYALTAACSLAILGLWCARFIDNRRKKE